MLDKPTGRVAFPNIRDICQSKYYNDGFLRDEQGSLPHDVPNGMFEQQFGKWETAFEGATAAALRVADGGGASLEERQTMAICVAIQLVRTPGFRQHISECVIDVLRQDATAYVEKQKPGITDSLRLEVSFPPEWHGALHQYYLWQSGQIPEIATDLFYYIWRIGVNLTNLPLCTSDHPVNGFIHDVLPASTPSRAMTGDGGIVKNLLVGAPAMYGLEIMLPLTPVVTLLMYHPDYFYSMQPVQGRRKGLYLAEVLHHNALQLLNAERQVFSNEDSFAIIQKHAASYAEADIQGTPKAEPEA